MERSLEWFVGIDWGSECHEVCIIDVEGKRRKSRQFRHERAELVAMVRWLTEEGGDPGAIGVGIEGGYRPLSELLVEQGFGVYALNPKQLDRFRDRHTVAGAKDDRLDAYVLADALRTDRGRFQEQEAPDESTVALRETTRRLGVLQEDLNRQANRLWEQLSRSMPGLLKLCGGANEAWFWEVVSYAVEVQQGKRLRRERVEAILARHRIRRVEVDEVVKSLREEALALSQATLGESLATMHSLVKILQSLSGEYAAWKQRLKEHKKQAGRVAEIVDSHPGLDTLLTGVLVGESGKLLKEGNLQALRMLAGTAPVTRRSGKSCRVTMRRANSGRLRNGVRNWARTAISCDPCARHRYRELRAKGHHHERALRGVADRLLAVLVATIREDSLYDPHHQRRSHLPLTT